MTRNRELLLKVGLLGLSDLRRLAPVGDIGYLNATDFYHDYEHSGLINDLMEAFWEQKKKYGWTVESHSSRYRNTDNTYYCPELRMTWKIDSGD